MPAVRNIPYGIKQPAVSAQVAQLEEFLGVTLFQRRPFALTAEGEKLYNFITPFFSNLDKIATELHGGQVRRMRIGASMIVLRDHVPEFLQNLQRKFPGLKVSLREGYRAQLESLLQQDEIDIAVTLIEKKTPPGFNTLVLLQLPMVLLVENRSTITSADQLWRQDKIHESLICLPPSEVFTKNFLQHLHGMGVDWFPSIEASSVDLVETYVTRGLGIGMSVAVPNKPFSSAVRALPLPGFPPAAIGAMWRGKATPLVQAFLESMQSRAKQLVSPQALPLLPKEQRRMRSALNP